MTDVNEGMVLRGRGLDKWYGAKHDRRQVLFGVDADVRAGECLAVIGGSGSGKTTLTRVLLGSNPRTAAASNTAASRSVATWRTVCACSPDWCSKARSIRWIRDGASADP